MVSDLTIRSEPTDFQKHVGVKEYLVEACLVNTSFAKINCVNSEINAFDIADPCERTEILVNSFVPDGELSVYQTGLDVVPEFLTSLNFPDTESIRIYNKGYPRDVCGQNGYRFVSQLSNAAIPFMSTDIFGTIYFRPTIYEDPGIYPLRLLAFKPRYPLVQTKFLNFLAQVTYDRGADVEAGTDPACNDAVIDKVEEVKLEQLHHLWGASEASETEPFEEFTVDSTCEDLQIYYQAERLNPETGDWEKVPKENGDITFDSNERTFAVDKCGPVSAVGDPECGDFAFTKIYRVRVVGVVNNMILTEEETSTFDIIIGPNCDDDMVSLNIPINSFTYDLTPDAPATAMTPQFRNSKAGCALLCTLDESGIADGGYESEAISDFNWSSGAVTIASDDVSLHGTSIDLTVTCRDPVSSSSSTSAVTTATVQFNNPCYQTTI